MKYRENTEFVLKGLNFIIKGKEKIGVAGRTGSGKSSLAISLFRIVEIEGNGSIFIDNIDIKSVNIELLRS